MQYLVQCTRTRVARKNLSVKVCTGLHGFALDQPSILIGPINRSEQMKRSETVGNGRKRSATVGNSRKHDQAKTCPTRISFKNKHFRATHFFFEGPKVSKGKRLETVGDRTFARQKRHVFTYFQTFFMNICYKTTTFWPSEGAISDCFQPFPLGHLWTFKKNCVARKCLFLKEMRGWTSFGLIMFPTVSDRCRPFPTVSDRFICSERLIGPINMEG